MAQTLAPLPLPLPLPLPGADTPPLPLPEPGADELAVEGAAAALPLSKNARKRLARYAAAKEVFARKKAVRKERKRELRNEQVEEARARGGDPPSPTDAPAAASHAPAAARHAPRLNADGLIMSRKESMRRMRVAQESSATLPSLVIDLCHDDLMQPNERYSLAQQIMYSYGANKRNTRPIPMHLTSLGGEIKGCLDKIHGFDSWLVHRSELPYWQAFPPASIVVLSADSPNVLRELEPGKVYVIGGLVDHNRHKGLVQGDAATHGLASARLPLVEYSTMATRKVLTVNHVFQMLLLFHATGSWPEAIIGAVPERKGLKLRDGLGDMAESNAPAPESSDDEQL